MLKESLFLLVFGIAGANAFALDWDYAADFSPSSNPAGGWTYGWRGTIPGTALAEFNLSGNAAGVSGSLDYWQNNTIPFMGCYKNNSGLGFDGGEGTLTPIGEASMHPGNGLNAVARWTAPANGTYFYSFSAAAFGGNINGISSLHLVVNGVMIDMALANIPYTYGPVHNGSVNLLTGDVMDFVVDMEDGNFNHDSTGVRAHISTVPEPATMLALGVGFVALLKRRKK